MFHGVLANNVSHVLQSGVYPFGSYSGDIVYNGNVSIAIRVYRNVDEAVVEVRNSGKGIEPEELEKIFTRFYQVEKSSTVSEASLSAVG